ncbi:zinc finger and SCAN domain-containing protein 21-like [Pseudorasbora parva]|uniref:zinc finger and SCAN domain-containing protein 21-like n=1 Tax=Pseudorasbora parva TaxID=51549 RepID=UPI00351F696E
MGHHDDPEAFLDLFEKFAEAGGWPRQDWPMHLILLLSGEAQLAAQQLPVKNLLVYEDLRRAILQRVGFSPEQHRQRFRSLTLGEDSRPFVMAQQLRDACRRWLGPDKNDGNNIVDRVVLEQFIAWLPKKTAQWVQCHRPASLDQAIQLAEDQMVACLGVGETLPAVSLSLPSPSSLSPSPYRPVPAPRTRGSFLPRGAGRGRPGGLPDRSRGPRAPPRGAERADREPSSDPITPLSPRQFLDPLTATGAAGKPEPACWRCGDPGHFVDRCPVMEVGTLIRIPDAPRAAPDRAGLYQIP